MDFSDEDKTPSFFFKGYCKYHVWLLFDLVGSYQIDSDIIIKMKECLKVLYRALDNMYCEFIHGVTLL